MSEQDKKRAEELMNRIDDQIEELEGYLEEFQNIEVPDIEEYKKNFEIKAVCERYFEKIIEPIIAIAFLIIRMKKFTSPESEEHAFTILSNNKIISEEFAKRLKDAKDMRNRIIHNYITVDDSIVYHAVTEEIIKDAEDFLEAVKKVK